MCMFWLPSISSLLEFFSTILSFKIKSDKHYITDLITDMLLRPLLNREHALSHASGLYQTNTRSTFVYRLDEYSLTCYIKSKMIFLAILSIFLTLLLWHSSKIRHSTDTPTHVSVKNQCHV